MHQSITVDFRLTDLLAWAVAEVLLVVALSLHRLCINDLLVLGICMHKYWVPSRSTFGPFQDYIGLRR